MEPVHILEAVAVQLDLAQFLINSMNRDWKLRLFSNNQAVIEELPKVKSSLYELNLVYRNFTLIEVGNVELDIYQFKSGCNAAYDPSNIVQLVLDVAKASVKRIKSCHANIH